MVQLTAPGFSGAVYFFTRMNKFFIFLLLFAACNCNKSKKQGGSSNKPQDTVFSAVFKAEPGWDIYKGGAYRYGPSIIENSDGSIDAWFAAPGETFGEKILNYKDTGVQSPLSLQPGNTAAQRLKTATPFYAIAVSCPNWHSAKSTLRLSLYRWRRDYATTVSQTALSTKVYTHYTDNQNLQIAKENRFSAGEYLWVLSDPSGTAGVWKKDGDTPGVSNYMNGQMVASGYQSFILLNKSSGAYYWDQASYKSSIDGGITWTAEEMVLKPSEYTRDQFSVCDPGAIKFGGYYYIGYTSTEDPGMVFNHVYVARSVSPAGPWEKWNGKSWGGNPEPVISFNGDAKAWGAGEPSMVIKNDSLFFYYTWTDTHINETRVATADARNVNWPAKLTLHGTAIDKISIAGADHCDVKYRDDLQKFQAIHAASRLTPSSYIVLWQSDDGLSFTKLAEIKTNLKPYLHNCGWSGDENGHINPRKKQYLSYAYGPDWGKWNTAWHPVRF